MKTGSVRATKYEIIYEDSKCEGNQIDGTSEFVAKRKRNKKAPSFSGYISYVP